MPKRGYFRRDHHYRGGHRTILLTLCIVLALGWFFLSGPNPQPPVPHDLMPNAPDSDSPLVIKNAIATNLQNNVYVEMALTLGYTIQKYNPRLAGLNTEFVALVPRNHSITLESMSKLKKIGWKIREEEEVKVNGTEALFLGFQGNFLKYRVWTWTEYHKILLLDADTLCLGDISLLLHDGFDFGAVPDAWPNSMPDTKFNAGVMSLTPSLETFKRIYAFTISQPLPWDAEQGILNAFFLAPTPGVIHPHKYTRTVLPMKYNLNVEAQRSHLKQWDDVWPDARIVHFTQAKAYWLPDCQEGTNCTFAQSVGRWHREYKEMNSVYGWVSPLSSL